MCSQSSAVECLREKSQKFRAAAVAVLKLGPLLALLLPGLAGFAATDQLLVLGTPAVASNQVHLTLAGEPDVPYVLHSTVDFQIWSPVLTNNESGASRSFVLDSTDGQVFYRASRQPLPIFFAALAVVESLTNTAFLLNTDSFDSSDPDYSANWNGAYGLYPQDDVNRTRANGDVVTDGQSPDFLILGDARIKGTIRTEPDGGVALGASGSVGDRAWVESNQIGVQPGHLAHDRRVYFPPVELPATTWTLLNFSNHDINGVAYGYVITNSGDYLIEGSTRSIYVGSPSGNPIFVRINMNGLVNIVGNHRIHVASNAVVQFYMNSTICSFGGYGVINENHRAMNFQYYGLPVNTRLAYGVNGDFTGVIYAPSAHFILGGGGIDPRHFTGSSVTKSIKLNNNLSFHFDENLLQIGPGSLSR